MALQTPVNITTATTTLIGKAIRRHQADMWHGTIFAAGTFGGTTITWSWSHDGGTTKHPITSDAAGTAVSTTAATSFGIDLNTGASNTDRVNIYATTTGGSSINLTVGVLDNN